MRCLAGATEATSAQPICRNLPVPAAAASQDGFEEWLGLMEVVEALCPEWPRREIGEGGDFRM